MSATVQALNVFLPLAYLVAAALYGMAFGGPDAPAVHRSRRIALIVALFLHAAFFATRTFGLDTVPELGTWGTVSAVAFSTALLYTFIARFMGQANSGVAVLGVVFVMQTMASAFGSPPEGDFRVATVPILHVATSLLATSTVILSGIHGVLYLVLYRQMRRRVFGVLFKRLPDLQELAKLMRRSALAGFILLGIGLNVGIGWAHAEGLSGFSYRDIYVLIILGLWIHLGIVAFSKRMPGLNAWRAALASALGLLIVLSAFLVTLTRHTFHFTA